MLLKFYSPTCQPCKQLDTVISQKYGSLDIESVNVTSSHAIVTQYGVRAVPTLVNVDTEEKFVGLEPILGYLESIAASDSQTLVS